MTPEPGKRPWVIVCGDTVVTVSGNQDTITVTCDRYGENDVHQVVLRNINGIRGAELDEFMRFAGTSFAQAFGAHEWPSNDEFDQYIRDAGFPLHVTN